MTMTTARNPSWISTSPPDFLARQTHRDWLLSQALGLIRFFQVATYNPAGGFFSLDRGGKALPALPGRNGTERQIHDTTRMVHCYVIAQQLGVPGAERVIDHGMAFIWNRHRDGKHGGYHWSVDDAGPVNASKQAYGHAFVLLAGASAKVAGHPDADRLIADVTHIIRARFWDGAAGAMREEFSADWAPLSGYRGQNSNMHLTESLMAAFEATEDMQYLQMAERVASLIIDKHARAEGWRVAEHFTDEWEVDRSFKGDPMFRPPGTTPGHALEWSRLLVQLWELGERQQGWMLEAAKALFLSTIDIGWAADTGGFYYTLDWDNRPLQADRFWWPCAEGIAAAAALRAADGDPRFEAWYRRVWGFVANHVIDHEHGGWHPELDGALKPVSKVFVGKPDLYHALQACLIPLLPTNGSITRGLQRPIKTPWLGD